MVLTDTQYSTRDRRKCCGNSRNHSSSSSSSSLKTNREPSPIRYVNEIRREKKERNLENSDSPRTRWGENDKEDTVATTKIFL